VVDVPPRTVAHDGPVYHRPLARPDTQDALQADTTAGLARPDTPGELAETIARLAASPQLASRSWVTDQYDRYVRGNTTAATPTDAGVLRLDESGDRGIALSIDCNARFCLLDPREGARLALAEAVRNVAATGARPVAVSDCLNFGSPEDPGVMWQFAEAVEGLAQGCVELGVPVTGGNVSFYNQTGTTAILPTPVVGVLGLVEDVRRAVPSGFGPDGDAVWLLGETRDELDGSAWAGVVHDHLGGRPPVCDLGVEARLVEVMARSAAAGLVSGAHDVSDGGLAQALVEAAVVSGRGASVTPPPGGLDLAAALFSESAGRMLVSVPAAAEADLARVCAELGQPAARLGEVGGDVLAIEGVDPLDVAELATLSAATLPAVLDA
jgi:phosphoribosylformylglycinamidine synthase